MNKQGDRTRAALFTDAGAEPSTVAAIGSSGGAALGAVPAIALDTGAGTPGFVGLVSPHPARRLVSPPFFIYTIARRGLEGTR